MAASRKPPPKKAGLPDSVVERIREDIARWTAGLWAAEVDYGPTCACNVRSSKVPCYKHFGPTEEPFSMFTE